MENENEKHRKVLCYSISRHLMSPAGSYTPSRAVMFTYFPGEAQDHGRKVDLVLVYRQMCAQAASGWVAGCGDRWWVCRDG